MISGYTDISSVIYEASERLGISNSEAYEMRFMRLILDAEIKIGTGMITARKVNIYEPGSLSFQDGQTLLIPHELLNNLCVLDSKKCVIDKNCYAVIGKRIVFSKVYIDPIILTFNGIEFDVNDEPVISINHKEAVVSYIVYMENFTRRSSKKVTEYVFQDSREWWQDRLGEARGDDAFPSFEDIKETGGLYHVVGTLHLLNGNIHCSGNTLDDVLSEYNTLNKVFYGTLALEDSLVNPEDYNLTLLNPQIETTTDFMSDSEFTITTTKVGRLVIVLPYKSGLINSMRDLFFNDIFDGYFNIIKDNVRNITIYVAKEFILTGEYKLTFKFSKI
jgi:hypothetical protein